MSRGTGPGIRTRGVGIRAGVDELPHRLVAVHLLERTEHLPIEPQRVAEAVVVLTDPDRMAMRRGLQLLDGLDADAGLVTEEQHDPAGLARQRGERRTDRGGAALAVVAVLDHLHAGQVDLLADTVGGTTDDHHDGCAGGVAGDGQGDVEDGGAVEREQLLGLAEPPRGARREDDGRDGHEARPGV